MNFELGQTIWYMMNGKPHSAPILSRVTVENLHEDWAHTAEQKKLFTRFGQNDTRYSTCHGVVFAHEAYASKEELVLKNLP